MVDVLTTYTARHMSTYKYPELLDQSQNLCDYWSPAMYFAVKNNTA